MASETICAAASDGVFHTLSRSRGLSAARAAELEKFNAFAPARAGRGVPVYAHWLTADKAHALTRITVSAGKTLAEHLLLAPADLVPAGPAGLFTDENFRHGENLPPELDPRLLSAARPESPEGGLCRAWGLAAGDPGWGGRLASWGAARPVTVVYPPELDPRPLLNEALALLPTAERWQITFITGLAEPAADCGCAWRWCPAGSPAAAAATGRVLDLTNLPPLRERNPLVDFARTGVRRITAARAEPEAPADSEPLDEVTEISEEEAAALANAERNYRQTRERRRPGGSLSGRARLGLAVALGLLLAGGIYAYLYWQEQSRHEAELAAAAQKNREYAAKMQREEAQQQQEAAAQKVLAESERARAFAETQKRLRAAADDKTLTVKLLRQDCVTLENRCPELFGEFFHDALTVNPRVTAFYQLWLARLRQDALPARDKTRKEISSLEKLAETGEKKVARAGKGKTPAGREELQKVAENALTVFDDAALAVREQLQALKQYAEDYDAGQAFFPAAGMVAENCVRTVEKLAAARRTAWLVVRNEILALAGEVFSQKPAFTVSLAALKRGVPSPLLARVPPRTVGEFRITCWYLDGARAECHELAMPAEFTRRREYPLKLGWKTHDNGARADWSQPAGQEAGGSLEISCGAGNILRAKGAELDAARLPHSRLEFVVNGERRIVAFE